MKKKNFGVALGAIFMFTAFFAFGAQEAQAKTVPDGILKPVVTYCVLESTGEVVGYSNDCTSGGGSCIDRTCS